MIVDVMPTDAAVLGFSNRYYMDHLFDQGYLTFSPDQRLLVVPEVRDRLIDAWGMHADEVAVNLAPGTSVGRYRIVAALGAGGPAFVRRGRPSVAELRRGLAGAKETIR